MAERQKIWVYNPQRQPKPKVPESVKENLEAKASGLVDSILKPMHVKPPRENEQFNYIVDHKCPVNNQIISTGCL